MTKTSAADAKSPSLLIHSVGFKQRRKEELDHLKVEELKRGDLGAVGEVDNEEAPSTTCRERDHDQKSARAAGQSAVKFVSDQKSARAAGQSAVKVHDAKTEELSIRVFRDLEAR